MSFSNIRPGDYVLPGHLTDPTFGKIDVRPDAAGIQIRLTILVPPQGVEAEGWQTGIALDGSHSMRRLYGRAMTGKVPPEEQVRFRKKGWLVSQRIDGREVEAFTREGHEQARAAGHVRPTTNEVEPLARDFLGYLARELDEDGGTTLIYWSTPDPDGYEVVGDITADASATLTVSGPQAFGTGTRLLPAMRYFTHRFAEAKRGMYVFITDGRIDDLAAVEAESRTLAAAIAGGRANPVKLVLIGVGDDVDTAQLRALDDLETGTGVDLWDAKLARELRQLGEIFAELVDEHLIVAPNATVYGADGGVVARFSDGLPAVVSLTFPVGTPWFELEVAGRRIRQGLVVPVPQP